MTSASGPDRRLNAYRRDLADVRLKEIVVADRYVAGREGSIGVGAASLRPRPEATAPQETQALFGEPVVVFESTPEWSWVQLQGDGYVGYLPTAALARPFPAPTHRLIVPRSFVYPRADIKSPIADLLSLGTEVAVERTEGRFAALAVGGFVIASHLVPIAATGDFVGLAEQLIGTPYQWGGKTSIGLDCSGLVQTALLAAGHQDCPRDSDMQEARLGERIGGRDDLGLLHRGDLVFWKGHVGIMIDGTRLLHANGHHMLTVTEPLADTVARVAATGSEVTVLKRLEV